VFTHTWSKSLSHISLASYRRQLEQTWAFASEGLFSDKEGGKGSHPCSLITQPSTPCEMEKS